MLTISYTNSNVDAKVPGDTDPLNEVISNGYPTRPTCLLWKVLLILWRYINHLRVKKSSLSTEVKTPFWGTNRSIRKFHRLGAKPWRRIVADKASTTRMMDRTGMYMEQSQKLLATWRSSHRTGASLSTNIQGFLNKSHRFNNSSYRLQGACSFYSRF
jgi:hypothetical protein